MVSATAIMPSGLPAYANTRGVFPAFARSSACCLKSGSSSIFDEMYFKLPPSSSCPLSTALRPCPGIAVNPLTSKSSMSFASSVTAFAKGCSLFFSREAAYFNSSFLSIADSLEASFETLSTQGMISVTTGCPSVTVPVLSNAIICILPAASSAAAVLYSIPCFAPTPLPTIMATGVASPSAHGQLITSTEIALATAKANVFPAISHPKSVSSDRPITVGTNMPDTLSAIRARGALVAAASETVRMICASVVSSPTFVVLHSI